MLRNLVIATHNKGKAQEIVELLMPLGISATFASTLQLPEPEETGKSFEANAILKAENAARLSGIPALADDSGLTVAALAGAPGIYSARWAGESKDFTAAMARVKSELEKKGLHPEGQDAAFVCVLAISIPARAAVLPEAGISKDSATARTASTGSFETHYFEGRITGRLTFPPRGNHGFGYDPIFIPDGKTLTFGQMTPAAKHAISHRTRAFNLFKEWAQSI